MPLNPTSGLRFGVGNVEINLLDRRGCASIRDFLRSTPEDEGIPRKILRCRSFHQIVGNNHFLRTGRRQARDFLLRGGVSPTGSFRYVAVGSNGAAVTDTQEALVAEVFRKEVTRRIAGEVGGNPECILQFFIEATEANGGGSQPLAEAGLFSFQAGGFAWARFPFISFNKDSDAGLTIQWRVPLLAGVA